MHLLQTGRGLPSDIRPPPPRPLMSATPQGFHNQQQQRGAPPAPPNQNPRMPMMPPFGMPPMGMPPQGGFPSQGFPPHAGMGPQGMGGPSQGMQGMPPPGMPMMPFGFQQFPNQGTCMETVFYLFIKGKDHNMCKLKLPNDLSNFSATLEEVTRIILHSLL